MRSPGVSRSASRICDSSTLEGIIAARISSVRFITLSARCKVATVTLSPAASSRATEGWVIPSRRASCAWVRPSASRAVRMIAPVLMQQSLYRLWRIGKCRANACVQSRPCGRAC